MNHAVEMWHQQTAATSKRNVNVYHNLHDYMLLYHSSLLNTVQSVLLKSCLMKHIRNNFQIKFILRIDSPYSLAEIIMVSDSDFNVGRFLLFPGRRLCGLLFKLEPRRGILEELSDISFKAGAVELYVNFSMPFTGESIMSGVVFLDSTNMNISVDDLAEKMRSVSGVKSIKIIKPTVEGLIADYMNHRLMLAGERAIIIRRSIYAGISKRMREQFGTAGEAFLFHLGHNAGMEYGKSHLEMAKKLGISDPAEIIKSVNLPLFSAVGFGRPEIIEITTHPSFKAIVRVYDCFECETGMESKKPYSQFIRGMLAGYLSSLLNKRVLVEETECIAKGDPYCELTATQV